ncbi:hypothetical protein WJX72_010225 [[Myrmecia] bisecta]|uniref:CobW C-terminal domain-containing protein n=1 Tax=[Myrmecia] bisecta TaxID=41462 RepID=A0AAW1R8W2_9CHLO
MEVPISWSTWKQVADAAFTEERYGDALPAYTSAIAAHDADTHSLAALYSNRAASQIQRKDFQAALEDGKQAAQLRPDWGMPYFRQVMALVGLQQYEKAWACRQQGLRVDPSHEPLLEAEAAIPARLRRKRAALDADEDPRQPLKQAKVAVGAGLTNGHSSQPLKQAKSAADARQQAASHYVRDPAQPVEQAKVALAAVQQGGKQQLQAGGPAAAPGAAQVGLAAAVGRLQSAGASRKLPITVISGFLGAGKTTLLNRVLQNQEGFKVAVIVNDMAEVNIDAQLVSRAQGKSGEIDSPLVELTNGCICCTLQEDLLQEVAKLVADGRFDYLIIESTGISEPMPVAASLEAAGSTLGKYASIDTMATVADAQRLLADLDSGDLLANRGAAAHSHDKRTVADLIMDQLEFADVLLLNKCDLVPGTALDRLEATLKRLNPHAHVVRTTYCNVSWRDVMQTHRFNVEWAWEAAGWQQELLGSAHTPETQEYGISSFVYRSTLPFHPARLWQRVLEERALPPCLRSKGSFWLAARPHLVWEWSTAGASRTFNPYGLWKPSSDKAADGGISAADRKQEVVFIGVDLDEAGIRRVLDGCLLTAEELTGSKRHDPFPTLSTPRQRTSSCSTAEPLPSWTPAWRA